MTVSSINYYQPAASTSSASSSAGTTNLTIDDFFTLMIAQLKNQDMYNTTDNSEFIAQMAQFSMVQALSDLSSMSQTAYSVNLVGKEATVAYTDEISGELFSTTGTVESVNLFNGEAEVVINGTPYALSSVMKVGAPQENGTTVDDFLKQIQNSISDSISDSMASMAGSGEE